MAGSYLPSRIEIAGRQPGFVRHEAHFKQIAAA
jgi:hypothetical protein